MKVEFLAFPKAFAGNVAVFVAAEKQLLATAQILDRESGGTLTRALGAGRFTGGKGQSLTVLGHAGANIARLLLLGVGKARDLDARAAEGLGGVMVGERTDTMSETDLMRVRADLGMVFQEGALFDSLTVAENVGYKLSEESHLPDDEVRRRVHDFAPGGGFVFASVHNIQADVPPENIMAMWEAYRECADY